MEHFGQAYKVVLKFSGDAQFNQNTQWKKHCSESDWIKSQQPNEQQNKSAVKTCFSNGFVSQFWIFWFP